MTAAFWRRCLPPALMALLVWLTPGLLRGEAYGRYVAAQALIDRHSATLDGHIAGIRLAPDAPWQGIAYVNGHYYLAQSPLVSWLAGLWYALGTLVAGMQPGAGWAPLMTSLLVPVLAGLLLAGAAQLTQQYQLQGRGTLAVLLLIAAFLLWPAVGVGATGWLLAAAALSWLMVGSAWQGRWARLGQGLLAGTLAAAQPWLAPASLMAVFQTRPALGWRLTGWLAALVPVAVWQTLIFGRPWRLAEQFLVTPPATHLPPPAQWPLVAAGLLGVLVVLRTGAWPLRATVLLVIAGLVLAPGPIDGRLVVLGVAALGGWCWLARSGESVQSYGIAMLLTAAAVGWSATLAALVTTAGPPSLISFGAAQRLLVASAVLGLGLLMTARPVMRRTAVAVVAGSLIIALGLRGGDTVRAAGEPAESLVAPFTTAAPAGGEALLLWRLGEGAQAADGRLTLPTEAAWAASPLVAARVGERYCAQALPSPGALLLSWEDDGHRVLAEHGAVQPQQPVCFAAPPGTTGVRVMLRGGRDSTVIEHARLWSDSVRVAPLPDGKRAALAFTFDWESAMGGLIHSRGGAAAYEGEHAGPDRATTSEAVEVARQRGLRMRRGAEILNELFRPHGIRGTFYSTGYNLLTGNEVRQTFAGDPTYRWASRKNGWASDYWLEHPWYGDDPYGTEARHPAWYFGSLTLELAAEGHEIESHTFGHLYVRGTTPDELEADQREWNRVATALGLAPARSFAFPWTSSNSVKEPHYQRLWQLGVTSVTRMYELRPGARFELDEVTGMPGLLIYPDAKLDSTPEGRQAARRLIDELLARGGYQSLWTHPEEVVDPAQVAVWEAVVRYAAEARARGLWIAPLTEIVDYVRAARAVDVVPVTDGGLTRVQVYNPSALALDGLTLEWPAPAVDRLVGGASAEARDAGEVIRLEPGEQREVVVPAARGGSR